MSTDSLPNTCQVVLLNITYDPHPLTDQIVLRYNDGGETYLLTLFPITEKIYPSVKEWQRDPNARTEDDMIILQYLDSFDAVDGDTVQQRVLTYASADKNAEPIIFYEQKCGETLSGFVAAGELKDNSVMIFSQVDRPRKEILTVTPQ